MAKLSSDISIVSAVSDLCVDNRGRSVRTVASLSPTPESSLQESCVPSWELPDFSDCDVILCLPGSPPSGLMLPAAFKCHNGLQPVKEIKVTLVTMQKKILFSLKGSVQNDLSKNNHKYRCLFFSMFVPNNSVFFASEDTAKCMVLFSMHV